MADARTVSELGEDRLLARIRERVGAAARGETWSGDDAAVIAAPGDRVVYTTDVLVEGVDFDLAYCLGSDVGWKAVAVNVSDVAAMGARPSHAVAGLSLPPETLVSTVDGIVEGLLEAARSFGLALVGGDLSRASELSLYVALVGAAAERVALRSGARPGDTLCVTGSLGGSAGGLIALRRGLAGPGPTGGRGLSAEVSGAVARLAARHLRPHARLEEGTRLAALGATALIDVSDGLAVDVDRLVGASGVGCEIDPAAVPVDPDLGVLADAVSDVDVDPFRLALLGGEDFELVATLPAAAVPAATSSLAQVGAQLSQIGTVVDSGRTIGGVALDEWKEQGWDHLLGR